MIAKSISRAARNSPCDSFTYARLNCISHRISAGTTAASALNISENSAPHDQSRTADTATRTSLRAPVSCGSSARLSSEQLTRICDLLGSRSRYRSAFHSCITIPAISTALGIDVLAASTQYTGRRRYEGGGGSERAYAKMTTIPPQ
jgi:hypothetical protein